MTTATTDSGATVYVMREIDRLEVVASLRAILGSVRGIDPAAERMAARCLELMTAGRP